MKAKIFTYTLKGKANIWWEVLKNVRGIIKEELTWSEFEKFFRNQYLSERYFDSKAKEFYKLRMGQILDEEYITKFLEMLRYMSYLKDGKEKSNGSSMAYLQHSRIELRFWNLKH